MTNVTWIRELQAESEKLGLYDMPPLSPWRIKRDVDGTTHYAVRDDASEPSGVARLKFQTEADAVKFVQESNALILRTMNGKKNG